MEPINSAQQQDLRGNDESTKGDDYGLWLAGNIVTATRQTLADSKAALADSQLENFRLTRKNESLTEEYKSLTEEYKRLQSLYDSKTQSLIQSWEEYDSLNRALQEQISENQQVSKLLAQKTSEWEAEVSRREMIMNDKDQVIDELSKDRARYIAMAAGLQQQIERERTATEEFGRSCKSLKAESSVAGLDVDLLPAHRDDVDEACNNSSALGKRKRKGRKSEH